MIEKFNFYDIYGYFLPGVAFLAILWVPFGLVKGTWPSSDWSSALIAAAIAYFLGHLLQNIVTNAIPSQRKGKTTQAKTSQPELHPTTDADKPTDTQAENRSQPVEPHSTTEADKLEAQGADTDPPERIRYPSDYFLDPGDPELPEEVKKKIARLVDTQFGLNLQLNKIGDKKIDKVRNNAFLLARQVLIQGKAVSYAEQFQGMYTVTRGLFAVFGLAFTYWLGWFFSPEGNKLVAWTAIFLLAATIFALIVISLINKKIADREISDKYKRGFELGYVWCVAILFLSSGYLAGMRYHVKWRDGVLMAFLAVCALLASFRFKRAYDYFAERFAGTVWRDFLAYNVKAKEPSEPSKQGE